MRFKRRLSTEVRRSGRYILSIDDVKINRDRVHRTSGHYAGVRSESFKLFRKLSTFLVHIREANSSLAFATPGDAMEGGVKKKCPSNLHSLTLFLSSFFFAFYICCFLQSSSRNAGEMRGGRREKLRSDVRGASFLFLFSYAEIHLLSAHRSAKRAKSQCRK